MRHLTHGTVGEPLPEHGSIRTILADGAPTPDPAPRARRSPTIPLMLAVVGTATLLILGGGVEATLSALADGDASPELTTGTLLLAVSDDGDGFGTDLTDMAPGDVVDRFVDVTNTGTLDAIDLTLAVTTAGAAELIVDGAAPSTTRAVTIAVDACSVAWDTVTSTCAGTTTPVLAPSTLGDVDGDIQALASTLASDSAEVTHVRVRLSLPDQDETSTNGTLPTSTVQGKTVTVTVTFRVDQRDAVTTSS